MNATLLLGLASAIGAPGLKDRPNAAALVGDWVCEAGTVNGVPDPEPSTLTDTFTAEGKWIAVRRKAFDKLNRRYTVNPKADPPTVDFTIDRVGARPGAGPERPLGIFRLEGDTLTVCMAMDGEPRPSEFAAPAGSHLTLFVFKRVKKE
jgi:uncharacterized protein (TIGR03067 family)